VASKAAHFAHPFGLAAWAQAAGLLHDIGKNSDPFQDYIRGKGPSPDHSTAGASVAEKEYGAQCGRLLAFAIAGHHAGLAPRAGAWIETGVPCTTKPGTRS